MELTEDELRGHMGTAAPVQEPPGGIPPRDRRTPLQVATYLRAFPALS